MLQANDAADTTTNSRPTFTSDKTPGCSGELQLRRGVGTHTEAEEQPKGRHKGEGDRGVSRTHHRNPSTGSQP